MQTFKVDFEVKTTVSKLNVKQGDVGRKFKVILLRNGEAYPVPEGAKISVWYSGASGEGNYTKVGDENAVSVSGNEITVELIAQMLTHSGKGEVCLAINTADGDQIATWNIPYSAEKLPGADSEEAQQYYSAFSEVIKQTADAAGNANAVAESLIRAKENGEFDGHTPEKGVDYWTEADKQEIVNDVLASLPTAEGVGF